MNYPQISRIMHLRDTRSNINLVVFLEAQKPKEMRQRLARSEAPDHVLTPSASRATESAGEQKKAPLCLPCFTFTLAHISYNK